jgi:hypothetical protein
LDARLLLFIHHETELTVRAKPAQAGFGLLFHLRVDFAGGLLNSSTDATELFSGRVFCYTFFCSDGPVFLFWHFSAVVQTSDENEIR